MRGREHTGMVVAVVLGLLTGSTGCPGSARKAEADAGGNPSTTGGDGGNGTAHADGGLPTGDAGALPVDAGALPVDAGALSGDAGGLPADAGSLEEPYQQFCQGSGSPIPVGSANTCSGQLAEDTFQFALCACDALSVGAQLSVDAFDSTQGGYGASGDGGAVNLVQDGHLATNGGPLLLDKKVTVAGSLFVAGGDLQVGPSSTVGGNLYVYGNALETTNTSLQVARNAFIHGNVAASYAVEGDLTVPPGASVLGQVGGTTRQAEFPQILPCACAPGQVLDVAGIVDWSVLHNDNSVVPELHPDAWVSGAGPGTLTLPCGRFSVQGIHQGGSFTLRATGRVVLFVDGDLDVGGLTLAVDPGAELDLFVKGNVAVGSAAQFGNAAAPSKVRTYVGGTMSLHASSVFAGNVYAPHADVEFSAATEVYGSLFVHRAIFGASASVHYDRAIRQAGAGCPSTGVDGGVPGLDGGVPVLDAGLPGADAGVPGADGGVPGADAGVPGADGGSPVPDAGAVTPPDAGVPECTDRCVNVCGNQSCVIPLGGSGGTCGGCTGDLDCCFPLACDLGSGNCILPG